jgi:bacillithiol system protein YtxJ
VSLAERTQTLSTPEEVDAFLARHPKAVLLKLGTCHKNALALREVTAQLEAHADLPLGLLRVVESRLASNHVASMTGIVHESPQLVLFVAGRAVFERNNWEITAEAVREGLGRLAPEAQPAAEGTTTGGGSAR